MRSNSSSVYSAVRRMSSAMPALLNAPSRRPWRDTAPPIRRSTSADFETSVLTKRASPPGILAIRKGLGAREALSSDGRGWRDVTLSLWEIDDIDEYRIPAMGELLVGLHTGGGPVRSRLGRAWSQPSPVGSLHLVPPSA